MDTMQNAWLLEVAQAEFDGFSVTHHSSVGDPRVHTGDGLLLVEGGTGFAVGRVYRVKETSEGQVIYLDLLVRAADPALLGNLGIEVQMAPGTARLEWGAFEQAVVRLTGSRFGTLPALSGKTKVEQAYVRELLRLAVVDDLLGPANGPHEEIVGMSVRDRYLVGELALLDPGHNAPQNSEFAEEEIAGRPSCLR